MPIIRKALMAALGLGAAFTVIYGVADPMAAFAEVRQIYVTGQYFIVGAQENFADARERAKKEALRMAAEEVSVLVKGYTESRNSKLTKDEILSIAAAILSVKKTEYTFETDSSNNITVLCHIVATADSNAITKEMLKERDPSRRDAQIAEYEAILKNDYSEKNFAIFQKLAALDPSNLVAMQYACLDSLNNEHRDGHLRYLEGAYATHAYDLEACAYLANLYFNGKPHDANMALVYANRGIEIAKKRYSQQEIHRIANCSYIENGKLCWNKDVVADYILLNPVYLIYSVKCEAMDELVGEQRFYNVEQIGNKIVNRYKTDW